jgi:hypothetical protein
MPEPTEDDKAAQAIMDRALTEMAAVIAERTGSGQPICTNYVLVAEWSTLDGEQWITREWDERRPVWQRDGLLHHALHGQGNWGGGDS